MGARTFVPPGLSGSQSERLGLSGEAARLAMRASLSALFRLRFLMFASLPHRRH
jgi:hypothetical protein